MAVARIIECWDDTRGNGTCRGESCGQSIVWMEVVKSGRKMCFDKGSEPLRTHHDPQSHRLIAHMDAADAHWGKCPDQNMFRNRSTRR